MAASLDPKFKPGVDPKSASRKLRSLSDTLQTKAINAATRGAASPAKNILKANTPIGPTGDLSGSISNKKLSKTAKARLGVDPSQSVVLVGPNRKVGGVHQGYKGRFLELGTKNIKARGFIARSSEQSAGPSRVGFYNGLQRHLDKTAASKQL